VMKLLSLVVALGLSCVLAATETSTLFEQYKQKFNKNYSADEVMYRMNVFKENLDRVNAHNAEAAAGKHSFTLEMNQFADMTNAEYRQRYLGLKRPSMMEGGQPEEFKTTAVPDAFDWRTHKPAVVNAVKNQGQCGSCWAFSAVATMEGAYALKTGTLKSFSEQQVVDCCNGGANNCNVGGEMYQGVEYVVKAGGIESESDYPYQGTSGGGCKFDKSKIAGTVSGFTNVTSGDEAAVKVAAYNKPVLSIGIDASSFWFQLYSTGVYDDSSCKNDINDLDHGVAIVGYGTDSSSGKDYWIVRNSWGAGWGQAGYIWMVRNKNNQCGVATQVCYALP
jgi:C1A family cysteine protease